MRQEMDDFISCVLGTAAPQETGADGRAVLELIYAAYRPRAPAG